MLFNSLEFAVFLVVVLAAYAALPTRGQNRMLLVASYVFYGAWDWRFCGLILASTLVDWAVGLALERARGPRHRRALLLASLVTNLGLLGVFKYADFFAASLARLLAALGLDVAPPLLGVVLPVGISFYTFQTLSYTIDVYRGRLRATRSLPDFALYVAFFPQLVAGPIERASRLLPQIAAPRRVDAAAIASGGWLLLWGTFKKVVVADNLGALVDAVYAQGAAPTGPEVVLATWAFAWQIYGDFSGYTDVARGVARLLGFELMLNFRLPYFATSPADFWRRWHVSLSTWLRDYLYVPLGGNRGGPARTARNLMLTMLLGGLWHGAAWTFVLWGAYQGVLLVAHRALRPALERLQPRGAPGARAWWLLRVLVMFQLTSLGWMIFRAPSFARLGELLGALRDPAPGLAARWLAPFLLLVGPVLLVQALQAARRDLHAPLRCPWPLRTALLAALLGAIVVLGEDFGQPFIYFQF